MCVYINERGCINSGYLHRQNVVGENSKLFSRLKEGSDIFGENGAVEL